jgi:hypothetical protein
VDSVNALHLEVFQKAKYEGWPDYDEAVPTKRSPFGIIPLLEDCGRQGKACEFLSPQLRYLATCMESDIPYTPVATKEERSLFKKLLEETLGEGHPVNRETFHGLTMKWNNDHVKLPTSKQESVKVFPKYINHLILHYKKWRITNKKRAAIDEANASDIIKALAHNQGIHVEEGTYALQPLVSVLPPQPPQAQLAKQYQPTATNPPTPSNPSGPRPLTPPPMLYRLVVRPNFPPSSSSQADLPPSGNNAQGAERKRRRQVCQHCCSLNCRRPWNKTGICNK